MYKKDAGNKELWNQDLDKKRRESHKNELKM